MRLKQFNYKKVKSTNQTAIKLINKLEDEFGLVISENQSKGKGQYGRKWISYKGNIFLSFFFRLEKINLSIVSLTKKNCFLVKNVISKYYKKKIIFKSPNDLLVEKKKFVEFCKKKLKNLKKIFGCRIGINLIKSPKIANYPTTNLFEITNQKINKRKIVKELKISFEKFLSKYYKTV